MLLCDVWVIVARTYVSCPSSVPVLKLQGLCCKNEIYLQLETLHWSVFHMQSLLTVEYTSLVYLRTMYCYNFKERQFLPRLSFLCTLMYLLFSWWCLGGLRAMFFYHDLSSQVKNRQTTKNFLGFLHHRSSGENCKMWFPSLRISGWLKNLKPQNIIIPERSFIWHINLVYFIIFKSFNTSCFHILFGVVIGFNL